MKTPKAFLRTIFITVMLLTVAGAKAQTDFTTLHGFTGSNSLSRPFGGVVLSGNTVYGTTQGGGSGNSGTVYKVNTDGTGFTIIYNFNGIRSKEDGAMPLGDLILSDNTLFGTTSWGGRLGHG